MTDLSQRAAVVCRYTASTGNIHPQWVVLGSWDREPYRDELTRWARKKLEKEWRARQPGDEALRQKSFADHERRKKLLVEMAAAEQQGS